LRDACAEVTPPYITAPLGGEEIFNDRLFYGEELWSWSRRIAGGPDETAVDEVTGLGRIGIFVCGDTIDGLRAPLEALFDAELGSGYGNELHLADQAGGIDVEGFAVNSAENECEVGGIQHRSREGCDCVKGGHGQRKEWRGHGQGNEEGEKDVF
jgi:hypothetical protein